MEQDTKNDILARVRAGLPDPHPLPEVPMYAYQGSPLEGFIKKLLAFDGRAVKFARREDAIRWLANMRDMDAASHVIYSSAPGVEGNFSEGDLTDLHDAHKIDTCVTEGEMGVGEMGSIWVTDQSLTHAACALLSRHLYVLIDSQKIVGGLHEAYAQLNLRDHQYGSFYTGPSATADIEAVHITGAQGPLSLTALIYNCEDAPVHPDVLVNPDADTSVWV